MTEKELTDKGYHLHHTALNGGYISRKLKDGIIEEYDGRFGKGYTVKKPNFKSTRYYLISYYVK